MLLATLLSKAIFTFEYRHFSHEWIAHYLENRWWGQSSTALRLYWIPIPVPHDIFCCASKLFQIEHAVLIHGSGRFCSEKSRISSSFEAEVMLLRCQKVAYPLQRWARSWRGSRPPLLWVCMVAQWGVTPFTGICLCVRVCCCLWVGVTSVCFIGPLFYLTWHTIVKKNV